MESKVTAKLKNAPISAKKVAIVMDMVRGKGLKEAKITLSFDQTKAAKMLLKLLKSAEANALNNNGLKGDNLYISEVWVGQGMTRKSGMFGGKGRFKSILKRSSNMYLGLSDKEGKDTKGK